MTTHVLRSGVSVVAAAAISLSCLPLAQPAQAYAQGSEAGSSQGSSSLLELLDDAGMNTPMQATFAAASLDAEAVSIVSSAESTKEPDATKKELIAALDKVSSSSKIKGFNGGKYKASTRAGKRLKKALKSFTKNGRTVGFVMIDLKTGKGISSSGTKRIYGASTVKGPYVVAINKWNEKSTKSVRGTIHNCIKYSDNDAYASLRSRYGSTPMKKMAKYCGVKGLDTTRNYIFNRPRDLAKLWVGNYWYFFKEKNSNTAWLKKQYKNTYMSFISSALGKKQTVYSKPGWGAFSASVGNIHDDAAIVMDDGHPYVMVIQSKAFGHTAQLKELARALDDVHTEMVSQLP